MFKRDGSRFNVDYLTDAAYSQWIQDHMIAADHMKPPAEGRKPAAKRKRAYDKYSDPRSPWYIRNPWD